MNQRSAVAADDAKLRLDKWLWAARFFKTRQLAHDALELGRVSLNGERVKPSRVVNLGDKLLIRNNQLEYHITVTGLSALRKSAKEVHLLYEESTESQEVRAQKTALLRAEHASFPHGEGKPSKKGRRDIQRFKETF